jgi:cyclic pyranopterin phosphate synthase
LRPNLVDLISQLSLVLQQQQQQDKDDHNSHNITPSLGMTTNGFTLEKQLPQLVEAGLTHVNISLDTLKEDKFVEITRRKGLDRVLGAIEAASELLGHNEVGGKKKNKTAVKVNCVVMKDFNDDELTDFVSQIQPGGIWEHSNVQLRFIEWMPFSDNGWSANRFFSYQDMLDRINRDHDHDHDNNKDKHNIENPVLTRTTDNGPNDTTKWYSVADAPLNQRVGFITSMTEHFCGTCNRLRITADGQLKVCLFGGTEVSLRDLLRTQQPHDDANVNDALRHVIYSAVQQKNFALGGHGSAAGIALANDNRPMTLIGG